MTTLVACPCGCGRMFSTTGSRGRHRTYFSPACALRVNRQPPDWTGRKHRPDSIAKIRVAASRPKPHLRGSANGMYGRVGALNPRYVDGSSPERQRAYASAQWKAVSAIVRERDNYRCQDCGAEKNGRRSLHLHHIRPWAGHPEERFDPDNIVTLCAACHRARHSTGGDAHE